MEQHWIKIQMKQKETEAHKNNTSINAQNSVIQIKTTTVKKQINQQMLADFGEHMNIPPPTIKEFLDHLPARTTQSLQIKYK